MSHNIVHLSHKCYMISYSRAYFIRKTKYLGGYIEQMGFVGRGNFAILLQALLLLF